MLLDFLYLIYFHIWLTWLLKSLCDPYTALLLVPVTLSRQNFSLVPNQSINVHYCFITCPRVTDQENSPRVPVLVLLALQGAGERLELAVWASGQLAEVDVQKSVLELEAKSPRDQLPRRAAVNTWGAAEWVRELCTISVSSRAKTQAFVPGDPYRAHSVLS